MVRGRFRVRRRRNIDPSILNTAFFIKILQEFLPRNTRLTLRTVCWFLKDNYLPVKVGSITAPLDYDVAYPCDDMTIVTYLLSEGMLFHRELNLVLGYLRERLRRMQYLLDFSPDSVIVRVPSVSPKDIAVVRSIFEGFRRFDLIGEDTKAATDTAIMLLVLKNEHVTDIWTTVEVNSIDYEVKYDVFPYPSNGTLLFYGVCNPSFMLGIRYLLWG